MTKADAASPAGVQNDGFWGYPVRPQTSYKASFYAKADDAAVGPVTVSLVDNNTGKAWATATVPALTTEWKKYEFILKTGAVTTSATNHLLISVAHPGSVWLDLVSVFPPTYQESRERKSAGPDGDDGGDASQISADAGRKLSGGRHDCGSLPVEADDRAAGGSSHTPESLELSLLGRHGAAGVSGVVRGFEY